MWRKRAGENDRQQVGCVAGLLGKSDLEIFSMAYQKWYSKDPGFAQLECHFQPYLTEGEVPYWVRSYVRGILTQHWPETHKQRRRDWPQGHKSLLREPRCPREL